MIQKKKTRDTSYSQSYKVIQRVGLDTIKMIWKEHGMYETGRRLHTSPYVIRYIAQKHGFQRPASKCPAIVKGVLNGNAKAQDYKTLDFSGINLNNKQGDKNDE